MSILFLSQAPLQHLPPPPTLGPQCQGVTLPSVLQNNPKSLLARSPFRSLMNGWSPQGTCMRDQLSVLILHLGENCLPSVSLW